MLLTETHENVSYFKIAGGFDSRSLRQKISLLPYFCEASAKSISLIFVIIDFLYSLL